jgi:putative redox protein
MADRTVHTRWHGGMRAVTEVGGFEIVVDEPKSFGGTDTGPQPTDLLLVSITSCFALAMAYAANKRGVELAGLSVDAVGTYDGPKFRRIAVTVTSDSPRNVLEQLMPQAERLCYVTNTLRHQPQITIALG